MKKKCLFPFILILSLMLSGCGQKAQDFSSERLENDGSGRETTQKIREELVSEAEGGDVDISGTEEISASGSTPEDIEGNAAASSAADGQSGETDTPVVYMTTDISSDGLMTIYQALAASPSGKIAVKLSTGEPGSNYLRTATTSGQICSVSWCRLWREPLWNAILPMEVPEPIQPCTIRWRRIMVIQPLRTWILWTRTVP